MIDKYVVANVYKYERNPKQYDEYIAWEIYVSSGCPPNMVVASQQEYDKDENWASGKYQGPETNPEYKDEMRNLIVR